MTDPIADMLTRIRNAQAVHRPTVVVPFSKLKQKLALILQEQNFITGVDTVTTAGRPTLQLTLR
ncbi:MAG: SSU ribosomal protein S8p (S15Ae), partial [uncultured bacterium]